MEPPGYGLPMSTTLAIFARYPEPGQVKTRLARTIGAKPAASLYEAFLKDIVHCSHGIAQSLVIAVTPADETSRRWFQNWLPDGAVLWSQPEGNLGRKQTLCFQDHLVQSGDRCVIIGSDSPTLPRDYVSQAFDLLKRFDCVVGPAMDGGYYLLGLKETDGHQQPRDHGMFLFENIDWGGPHVLEQTVSNIKTAGRSLATLPAWYDVDTSSDLAMLRGHLAAAKYAGESLDCPKTEKILALLETAP